MRYLDGTPDTAESLLTADELAMLKSTRAIIGRTGGRTYYQLVERPEKRFLSFREILERGYK